MTLPIFYAFIYMCIPPRWHSGKQSSCQCRRHRRRGFNPRVRKIPWRRKWQPTPMFLPGKLHGQRSLAGYSHEVIKSWTQLKRLGGGGCCYSVAKSSPTPCDLMDCSLQGSSFHEISQARILGWEWVAISSSRRSSWIRGQTHIFCIGRQILYH